MRKLKVKNGDIQNVHVAADPEAVLTNKAKAGTLRRSLRNRKEPRWLSDYMHKAPHGREGQVLCESQFIPSGLFSLLSSVILASFSELCHSFSGDLGNPRSTAEGTRE